MAKLDTCETYCLFIIRAYHIFNAANLQHTLIRQAMAKWLQQSYFQMEALAAI